MTHVIRKSKTFFFNFFSIKVIQHNLCCLNFLGLIVSNSLWSFRLIGNRRWIRFFLDVFSLADRLFGFLFCNYPSQVQKKKKKMTQNQISLHKKQWKGHNRILIFSYVSFQDFLKAESTSFVFKIKWSKDYHEQEFLGRLYFFFLFFENKIIKN